MKVAQCHLHLSIPENLGRLIFLASKLLDLQNVTVLDYHLI